MSLDPEQMPDVPPAAVVPADPVFAMNAMISAMGLCAKKAGAEDNAAEAKDYAAAAQSLAQALVVLDPSRLQGGDTPDARAASVPATSDGDHDGRVGE
jgi:hypothetical protein